MSSLKTLLDAARFLELQELQEQEKQHRATVVEAALATMETTPIIPTIPTIVTTDNILIAHNNVKTVAASNSPPQAVVISSSNVSSTFLQSPVSYPPTTSVQTTKVIDQDGQVTSTTANQLPRHRILNNSFDIMNPLTIDDTNGNETKRKQPPMVFRAGTREVHNKLEKHRRAHLKECFDFLKKQLPVTQDEKKTSNLSILHSALRYIQTLKRKERELEHEMERLAREKISLQQRLAVLKKDISCHYDNIDISKLLPDIASPVHGSITTSDSIMDTRAEAITLNHSNGSSTEKVIPILAKSTIPVVTQGQASVKEVTQPVQTTALSVLPMTYPVNQSLVLQKVAIVPKGLDGLTPLVSTHFITAQQQINGKVVPITQYVVKPVVVVSTASPRPS